jgi:hypothetical protein
LKVKQPKPEIPIPIPCFNFGASGLEAQKLQDEPRLCLLQKGMEPCIELNKNKY